MTTELTDHRVFERPFVWTCCGHSDDTPLCKNGEAHPADAEIVQAPEKRELRGADIVPDITMVKRPPPPDCEPSFADDADVNIPHRFVYHSPTGFSWGYGGSGPADLALNILALFVDAPEAWRLHQDYKWEVVARVPMAGGVIEAESVRRWIRRRWEREDAGPVVVVQGSPNLHGLEPGEAGTTTAADTP